MCELYDLFMAHIRILCKTLIRAEPAISRHKLRLKATSHSAEVGRRYT